MSLQKIGEIHSCVEMTVFFCPATRSAACLTSPDKNKVKVELKRSVRSSNGSVLQVALRLISPCLPLVVTREVTLPSYPAFHVIFHHLIVPEAALCERSGGLLQKNPTLVG